MSGTLRVLVVDDEPDLREFLIFTIGSEFPVEFHEAGSGSEAVAILKKLPLDLVLCDFNMPDGNGKFVYDFLSKLDSKPKFILITSDDKEDHLDITFDYFSTFYLQKPFDFDDLIEIISKIFSITRIDSLSKPFAEINIESIFKFDFLPFDVYVKLGINHHVKYFSSGSKFTEFDKSRITKLKSVFIKSGEFQKIIKTKERTVFESLILPEKVPDHPFELTTISEELAQLGLQRILDDKAVVEQTQKNLKTVFSVSYKP